MATTTTRIARTFVLLAETVTRDERGDTIEGDHGIMSADGFVSFANVSGDEARDLLDQAHADSREDVREGMPADELAEVLLGAIDYVDERADEAIYYGADLPDVGDDVPYVRAVVIRS